MTFVSDPTYAAAFVFHYHRLHAAIVLHDMAMQPAGALVAPDSPVSKESAA
jgi:hypothetical protein